MPRPKPTAKPTAKPQPVPLTSAGISGAYTQVPREGWREHMAQWHYWRGGESLCEKFKVRVLNRNHPTAEWPRSLRVALKGRKRWKVCGECGDAHRALPEPVPVPRTDTRTNRRSKHEEKTAAGVARTRSDLARASAILPPTLDAATAYEFVKLLHAGLPGTDALAYIAPDYLASIADKPDRIRGWLMEWARSKLVLEAATRLNHGEWQSLDPDARLTIALDKHYAELAYFLYTHDWSEAEGLDLKKCTDAREALAAKLEGSEAGDDTPMMAFMRALQEGTARFDKPVQLDSLVAAAHTPLTKGES